MRKFIILASFAVVTTNVFGMIDLSNDGTQSNSRQPVRRSERPQMQQAVQQSLEDASMFSEKTLEESNFQKLYEIINLTGDGDFEAPMAPNSRKRSQAEDNFPKSKKRKANSNQVTQQNQLEGSDLIQELGNNEKDNEDRLRQTDPEKMGKIEEYIETRKEERTYSLDRIKSALVYYCLHPEVLVKDISDKYGIKFYTFEYHLRQAKIINRKKVLKEEDIKKFLGDRKKKGTTQATIDNGVCKDTIIRHAKKRGEAPLINHVVDDQEILTCYQNGGNFEDICKVDQKRRKEFTRLKFLRIIGEQLSDEQKIQLVERNMDIIEEISKGKLKKISIIDKYKDRRIQIGDVCVRNFGECEYYLIKNLAHYYDPKLLGRHSEEWYVVFTSSTEFEEHEKCQIIDTWNREEGLSCRGLAEKYSTTETVICTILKWGRRKGLEVRTIHVSRKSENRKKCEKQWGKLTSDQKNLFKTISEQNVADRRMPSDEDLDRIKSRDNNVNKKFHKYVFLLCNDDEKAFREKFNITGNNSVYRHTQELEIWKDFAQEMQNAQANL